MKKILEPRICRFCKTTKHVFVYNSIRRKNKRDRYLACINCKPPNRKPNKEYQKKYYHTSNGKTAILKAIRKYLSKNPERLKAWIATRRLPRLPCEKCGVNKNIHKHHPNLKEPLRIVYLCPLHHKQAHML